jgi:hypothetical protein
LQKSRAVAPKDATLVKTVSGVVASAVSDARKI